ncbi:MAG: hypothetical protein KBT57_10480, partial [bacterium]|nr:hypothetical protein [Candidatus Limimorpha equi]
STDAANPSTFFIVLPVGTLSEGFEVEVIDKDSHGNWTVGTTKDNTIIRSRICQMPACTVKIGVQLTSNGIYWATCNLGATSPTRYGDYYAFGETEPYYTSLTWNSDGTSATAVGWKTGKENGYWWPSYPSNENNHDGPDSGDPNFTEPFTFVDGNNLKTDNDAAYKHYNVLGCELNEGRWRIPTAYEFSNMVSNTDHEYTSNYKGTGIAGWIYKGRGTYTGRSIFLPLAGYFDGKDFGSGEGDYTTATRYSSKIAYRVHYYIDKKWNTWEDDRLHRYYGETIRPIKCN